MRQPVATPLTVALRQEVETLRNALADATGVIDSLLPLAKPSLADRATAEFDVLCEHFGAISTKAMAQLCAQPFSLHTEADSIELLAPHWLQQQQDACCNQYRHRL